MEGRKIWFDLGILESPPLLFPVEYWRNNFVFANKDRVKIDKHLISVTPKKNIDIDLLAGILNSSLNALFREIHGRPASGEALARNEIWVNDAKKLPLLDPAMLNDEEKDNIKNKFKDLLENERTASEDTLKNMYRELDKAVMSALGMEARTYELEKSVEELLARRIKGGGIVRNVLLDIDTRPKVIKLKGADVIQSIESLDTFI